MPETSSNIQDVAERYLTEEKGLSKCKIFRVVNKGSTAFVGAKARKKINYDYFALEIDVENNDVISEDAFSATFGHSSEAKRKVQKKLDRIEGLTVDRSKGESTLATLAESGALERILYGKNPGYNSNSSSSSVSSSSSGPITFAKKMSDFIEGDWLKSPQCPECGSQKVGEENENAFQCRNCGEIFHTGVDISYDE